MTAGSIIVPTIIPLRAPAPGRPKQLIDSNTRIELKSGRFDYMLCMQFFVAKVYYWLPMSNFCYYGCLPYYPAQGYKYCIYFLCTITFFLHDNLYTLTIKIVASCYVSSLIFAEFQVGKWY